MPSDFESRGGKFEETTFFGLQYFIKRYLCGQAASARAPGGGPRGGAESRVLGVPPTYFYILLLSTRRLPPRGDARSEKS
eukprot:3468239-Pyramimonas_sp.AAC.1